jgi:hypothetical protein
MSNDDDADADGHYGYVVDVACVVQHIHDHIGIPISADVKEREKEAYFNPL